MVSVATLFLTPAVWPGTSPGQRLDPRSYSIHYQRGQLLMRLNRTEEGLAELHKVQQMLQPAADRVDDEVSGKRIAEPRPAADPQ